MSPFSIFDLKSLGHFCRHILQWRVCQSWIRQKFQFKRQILKIHEILEISWKSKTKPNTDWPACLAQHTPRCSNCSKIWRPQVWWSHGNRNYILEPIDTAQWKRYMHISSCGNEKHTLAWYFRIQWWIDKAYGWRDRFLDDDDVLKLFDFFLFL